MDLQRIEIKFYIENKESISPDDAFRIFNAWIPVISDEVLVDVADYSHVPDGPYTLLVGHDHNYALDDTDRQLGLYCASKHNDGLDPSAQISSVISKTLQACHRLESESRVRFRGNELLLTINDRLNAPNTESTATNVEPHVRTVASKLFAEADISIERDSSPKQRFNMRIKTDITFDISTLLTNINGG